MKTREEAVRVARREHGFFALISNEVKDPIVALSTYRSKDVVEKAFGNLKERLNCRRLLTSSDESLNGKLFVEFVALIYLAYINRKMQEKGLYKDYTMEKMLLELESIQSICEPGRAPIVCNVLEKQRKIYEAMEVMPPQ
ncbi:MAG: transposase [Lentisphaeria bacterium]|nr:transposase [Lentisphaeria bacterium]